MTGFDPKHPDWLKRDASPQMQRPKGDERDFPPEQRARVHGWRLSEQLRVQLKASGYELVGKSEDEVDSADYTTWVLRARDELHTVEVRVYLEDR